MYFIFDSEASFQFLSSYDSFDTLPFATNPRCGTPSLIKYIVSPTLIFVLEHDHLICSEKSSIFIPFIVNPFFAQLLGFHVSKYAFFGPIWKSLSIITKPLSLSIMKHLVSSPPSNNFLSNSFPFAYLFARDKTSLGGYRLSLKTKSYVDDCARLVTPFSSISLMAFNM